MRAMMLKLRHFGFVTGTCRFLALNLEISPLFVRLLMLLASKLTLGRYFNNN